MDREITVIPAEKIHYNEILRIYNEGFLPKFGFVSKKKELQNSFAHDFGLINLDIPEKVFVACDGEKVLGLLTLKFSAQGKEKYAPHLKSSALFRKYGITGIIRSLLLDHVSKYNPPAGELYIDSLSVSADARGLGIGTLLLKFAETFAEEKHLNRLSLLVMYENGRAKSLYERCGFLVVASKSFKWMNKQTGYSGAYFMVSSKKT